MNLITTKPYKPVWFTIPLIFGLSLIGFNKTIDIQLHDTYYVIYSMHLGILTSIILGVIGFLYWAMRKKKLVNWMTAIHLLITISTFVLIIISMLFKNIIKVDFDIYDTVNKILIAIIFAAIFSQIIFLINLIFSLIRSKEKK